MINLNVIENESREIQNHVQTNLFSYIFSVIILRIFLASVDKTIEKLYFILIVIWKGNHKNSEICLDIFYMHILFDVANASAVYKYCTCTCKLHYSIQFSLNKYEIS